MSESVEIRIKSQIKDNSVLLYMKGTPYFPQCGFSGRVAYILNELGVSYAFVNILENPDIRSELPKIANWPTFPQLYVDGELIGGCDIITEMFEANELLPILQKVNCIQDEIQFTDATVLTSSA